MLSPRILLIIALVRISRTVTSGMEDIDICNLSNGLMYCNCEGIFGNDIAVTCFVFNLLDPGDKLWPAFGKINDSIVALTFSSRQNGQLEFWPTTAFQHLPDLQTITVQDGKLGSLESGSVTNMSRLTRLLLERNEISSLQPYSISHLPKLKKLILSENYLSEILANCMVDLMELEELYLDRNNISRVESCAFCSMHNLKELVLWGNSLTDITEPMFRGLRYLIRLDLSRNHLKVISSRVFQSMPRLKEIDLRDNVLTYISDQAFFGLPSLMSIELNDNRLKTLPGTVFKYPKKLMTVDLSSNLMETVQEDVIDNMANAKTAFFSLRLEKNPLRCGCDLQWISRYVMTVKIKSPFMRELRHMECQTSGGTLEVAHLLNFTTCVIITEPPVPTTIGSALTVELNSTATKVPRTVLAEEKYVNLSCKTMSYFGLYLITAVLSLLLYYN